MGRDGSVIGGAVLHPDVEICPRRSPNQKVCGHWVAAGTYLLHGYLGGITAVADGAGVGAGVEGGVVG